MTLLMVIAVLIGACKKDKDPEPTIEVVKKYSGSGSKGDLITFSINQTNKAYTVNNETTGKDDNGNYTVKDGTYAGIYEVTANNSTFFAVELSDKVLAANFPTGNSENDISFGVSSSLSYLNNSATIVGDYSWIVMSNNPIDGSTKNKEWGVLTIKSDGKWIKKNYKGGSGSGTEYLSPNTFSGTLPLTSGDETGTWKVNGTHQERLDVTVDGVSGTLTGYVYGDVSSAAFVLDLGTGNGFLLGFKNTNATLSDISGTYNFIDVWNNGSKGAGNYIISSNGELTYNHVTTGGDKETGSFSLTQCSVLKNIYYNDNAIIGGENSSIYCVISGDLIMHFIFDDEGFASYGAGGKK